MINSKWFMAFSFWLGWGVFVGSIPGILLAQYVQARYHWFPRVPSLAFAFVAFDAFCGIAYAAKGFGIGSKLRCHWLVPGSGITIGAAGALYAYKIGGVFCTLKLLLVMQLIGVVEYIVWYKYAAPKAAALRRLLGSQDSDYRR